MFSNALRWKWRVNSSWRASRSRTDAGFFCRFPKIEISLYRRRIGAACTCSLVDFATYGCWCQRWARTVLCRTAGDMASADILRAIHFSALCRWSEVAASFRGCVGNVCYKGTDCLARRKHGHALSGILAQSLICKFKDLDHWRLLHHHKLGRRNSPHPP
jgi:hypothetical protein